MIVGQGAGVAAAVAVREGVPVREVDAGRVRAALEEQGCHGPAAPHYGERG
jgi:hypothetical protein